MLAGQCSCLRPYWSSACKRSANCSVWQSFVFIAKVCCESPLGTFSPCCTSESSIGNESSTGRSRWAYVAEEAALRTSYTATYANTCVSPYTIMHSCFGQRRTAWVWPSQTGLHPVLLLLANTARHALAGKSTLEWLWSSVQMLAGNITYLHE